MPAVAVNEQNQAFIAFIERDNPGLTVIDIGAMARAVRDLMQNPDLRARYFTFFPAMVVPSLSLRCA